MKERIIALKTEYTQLADKITRLEYALDHQDKFNIPDV